MPATKSYKFHLESEQITYTASTGTRHQAAGRAYPWCWMLDTVMWAPGTLAARIVPTPQHQLQHTQQEQQCRAHTQLSAGVRSTTRLQSTRHCFYCLCLLLLALVLASHSSPLSQYPPCKETVTETVLKLGLFLQRCGAGVADLVPGPAVSRSLMTPSWSSPSPAASHVTRDTRPGNVP